MRLLKFSLFGLFTFFSGLVLSGCGGTLAATNTALGTLVVSSSSVDFGQVAVGKTVSSSVTVSNKGTAAVQIAQLNLTGQSFSQGAGNSFAHHSRAATTALRLPSSSTPRRQARHQATGNRQQRHKRLVGNRRPQRHGRAGSHRADMRERIRSRSGF